MNFLYSDEPIIACSTGQAQNAAMAVLRISGFSELSAFQPFFSQDLSKIEPRRVYYTHLLEGELRLDDICLTYFQGPKSYNGENIIELSIHGNTLNIERVLTLFTSKAQCRLAQPGEFTYRALKNKKLNLSQVEGLDLFLNANSTYALNQGLSLLSGGLHALYEDLYHLFLKHKSALELSIDFIDDVGEEVAKTQFTATLNDFAARFETLYRRVLTQSSNLLQPEIVIAGLPNAGKSSLFNLLLADERAIVSPTAGTTRDYLSEMLHIEGVNYKLVDTAGIRESADSIEVEGIRRTMKKVEQSFFKILLINPFEMSDKIAALLETQFDVIYFTHADQLGFAEAKEVLVRKFSQLGPMGAISLLNTKFASELELYKLVNNKYLQITSEQPLLLERHKHLILQTKQNLVTYVNSSTYQQDVAILSSELNTLGHCLSELLGIISPDQILNSIFTNFCIGK